MILIISYILSVVGIVFIGIGLFTNKNREKLIVFGLIICVLTLIFGFGLLGNSIPVSTKTIPQTNCEIKKFSNRVIAVCDGYSVTEQNIYIYNNTEQFDLVLIQKLNSYENIIDKRLVFRRKPNK
jgi:hypothetical protein